MRIQSLSIYRGLTTVRNFAKHFLYYLVHIHHNEVGILTIFYKREPETLHNQITESLNGRIKVWFVCLYRAVSIHTTVSCFPLLQPDELG